MRSTPAADVAPSRSSVHRRGIHGGCWRGRKPAWPPRHLMKKIKYLFSSPPISSAVDQLSPLISSAVDRPSPPISSAGSRRRQRRSLGGTSCSSITVDSLSLSSITASRGVLPTRVFQRRPRKKRYILWFEEFSSQGGNPQRVREKEMEREGRARQREERE